MRRFGTVFPFVERGPEAPKIGRLVANHDFVRALLRYGTFDEFVFSNPSVGNLEAFTGLLTTWDLSASTQARIRLVSFATMRDVLARDTFDVMHVGGWGYFMPGLHALRRHYGVSPLWPITGVIHSLHGKEIVNDAVRLVHAGGRECDAIFCSSRDGLQALRHLLDGASVIAGGRRFAGDLILLPLGMDDGFIDETDAPRQAARREAARARLRIDPHDVVLLVLGRLTPAQKVDLGPLIRTFARAILPHARVPLTLVIAGSGTPNDIDLVRGTLQRYDVLDRTRLHANFPAGQKADVLALADIVVAPTDNTQETFGLSVLEALAASVPVVASRYDGYKDLVDDGVDGYLVETYGCPVDPFDTWFDVMEPNVGQLFQSQRVVVDMEQLSERVLRLAHDPDARTAFGAAGRMKVSSRYRWRRIIGEMEHTWNDRAAIARTLAPDAPAPHPWNLGADVVFPHYPAAVLTGETLVEATTTAIDERPYTEVASVVEERLVARLLAAAANGPVTIAALVAASRAAAADAWLAVTWLLKYGFLRRVDR